MREEADPWVDPVPAVWITLCLVMLFLLRNRWAEVMVSSLSASESSCSVLPKVYVLLWSVEGERNILQLSTQACLVLSLLSLGFQGGTFGTRPCETSWHVKQEEKEIQEIPGAKSQLKK